MKSKSILFRSIILILIVLLLAACGEKQLSPPTPTLIATVTPSATSTITPTSTLTNTPTVTPTLTPIPIMESNVADFIPIARCGAGPFLSSYTLVFSPDGKWLGTGGFGGIQIFSTSDPNSSPIFLGQDFTTGVFAFSPNGTILASITAYKIILWDFLQAKIILTRTLAPPISIY